MRLLLESKADPNRALGNGETATTMAAYKINDDDSVESLQVLLKHGANPNQADHNGATPVRLFGHLPLVTEST